MANAHRAPAREAIQTRILEFVELVLYEPESWMPGHVGVTSVPHGIVNIE
jgi:hypothetical protein